MAKSDYYGCYTTERRGALTGTYDGITPNYITGTYSHVAAVPGSVPANYTSPTVLATALQASLAASAITVVYSKSALTYTLTKASNWTITTTSGSLYTLLGSPTFGGTPGGATAGHTAYVSSARPDLILRPLIAGQSMVSDKRERAGGTSGMYADDRTYYSISSNIPINAPKEVAWTQPMEDRTAPAAIATAGSPLFTEDETALMPTSWERFFWTVRGHELCLLQDPAATACDIFMLRENSAEITAETLQRQTADYDHQWNLQLKAMLIGRQA